MAQNTIAAEPTGDYYIGRRLLQTHYKFWGYVRKAGPPMEHSDVGVMLHEKMRKLCVPDRETSSRIRERQQFTNTSSSGNFRGDTVEV